MSGMKDFIEKHFDKLFLGTLLYVLIRVLVHTYRFYPDHSHFMENVAGQVLAALLTLVTGARLFGRGEKGGVNEINNHDNPDGTGVGNGGTGTGTATGTDH